MPFLVFTLPFLFVQHWELGPADIGFSVNVTPVPLEQALDERRLKLTLDSQVWNARGLNCPGHLLESSLLHALQTTVPSPLSSHQGIVVGVGTSPDELFDFDPTLLLGQVSVGYHQGAGPYAASVDSHIPTPVHPHLYISRSTSSSTFSRPGCPSSVLGPGSRSSRMH